MHNLVWAGVLLLFFLLPGASWAAQAEQTAGKLDDILSQLNALDNWFSTADDKRTRLDKELRSADKEVANIGKAVQQAISDFTTTQNELAQLGKRRDLLITQRTVQAERIGEHLASAYRLSSDDLVKQLLNQESPDELDRMMRYHRYFSEARIDTLKAFEATVQELAENAERLTARTQELASKRKTLQTQQQELVGERDSRKKLIAKLNQQSESKSAQRDRLNKDRARLESLLTQIRQQVPELDGNAFAQRKGGLPWPLAGGTPGKIAASYGSTRSDGSTKWQGALIKAGDGDPVQAVFQGKVIFAEWLRGYGLLIIVDHGSGYMTLYGYADALLKSVGDWVESGETVAQAGRSGGQAESGLYFEVRQNGRPSNPLTWLVKP